MVVIKERRQQTEEFPLVFASSPNKREKSTFTSSPVTKVDHQILEKNDPSKVCFSSFFEATNIIIESTEGIGRSFWHFIKNKR